MSGPWTRRMEIAEAVLNKHRIPDENKSYRVGDRPPPR